MYMYTHICICVYVYICICIYVCVCVCVYIYIFYKSSRICISGEKSLFKKTVLGHLDIYTEKTLFGLSPHIIKIDFIWIANLHFKDQTTRLAENIR